MKPTKTLIFGLREAARRLRDGRTIYDWQMMSRCNCGILAQVLLGCRASSIEKAFYGQTDYGGPWTSVADQVAKVAKAIEMGETSACKTTGLTVEKIYEALYQHGLENKDFLEIEYGAGKQPDEVAASFDKLADGLEKQRAKQNQSSQGFAMESPCATR